MEGGIFLATRRLSDTQENLVVCPERQKDTNEESVLGQNDNGLSAQKWSLSYFLMVPPPHFVEQKKVGTIFGV
jgi:hypothetical protein